jgi:hypothetical protein
LTFQPQAGGIFLGSGLPSSSHIQLSGLDGMVEGRLAARCWDKRLSGLGWRWSMESVSDQKTDKVRASWLTWALFSIAVHWNMASGSKLGNSCEAISISSRWRWISGWLTDPSVGPSPLMRSL